MIVPRTDTLTRPLWQLLGGGRIDEDHRVTQGAFVQGSLTSRILIQIPVIHSQQDMGSLADRLPAAQTYQGLARTRWAVIQQGVQALTLDWRTVNVYQDGLPDTEPDIVQRILAEVKSDNYDLLRWLVRQGANLIGTESVALMREEYEYLSAVLGAKDAEEQAEARRRYSERAAPLLEERDVYIAGRIVRSLPPGGTGLLLIGQAHRVASHLPSDIVVRGLSYYQLS